MTKYKGEHHLLQQQELLKRSQELLQKKAINQRNKIKTLLQQQEQEISKQQIEDLQKRNY